ncbi:alanyl-tRNA editing protein [Planococcus ruber]|uniref:alanyl-tRNA editing protein n=1 Tax=Planococcus ruber TaxID=2027871 RepID=UPI001FEF21CC|nr:alanine--tRNA ligase-related protein [Planococcus ruber]MCJ1908077.1 alanine--tRNA ligase-related protein [Planococcus ruber]
MTEKLYYQDPEIKKATVQVIGNGQNGIGFYAILDQTCFYPEGGGQPGDIGKIGEIQVTDVQTVDGEILHYTEALIPYGQYEAEIDWKRRYDHMQQHAGQHVLSAVFDDFHQMKTTSFHLGEERVSIDLNTPSIDEATIKAVEKKANDVIRRHLPIETEWVAKEQAKEMNLRKPPAVEGDIRLVSIEGVDLNACGGTHPKNTAEIGLIKLIADEKAKGGTRVYFLCGDRAMSYFQLLAETSDELVKLLNAPVKELGNAASDLLKEKAANEKKMKELHQQLLEKEAESLASEAGTVIEQIFHGRPIKEVQQLARLVIAQNPGAYLLFISMEGEDVRFVGAKGEHAEGNMKAMLPELLALTDGKGGGNAGFVQGGGKSAASPEVFLETFRKALKIT